MEQTSENTTKTTVYRGVLRLLKSSNCDASSYYRRHIYNGEQLKITKALLRSRKRSKSKRQEEEGQNDDNNNNRSALLSTSNPTCDNISPVSNNLEEGCISCSEFTLFFFFHPKQPHSLQLRSTVAEFCTRHSEEVVCFAFFGGDKKKNTITPTKEGELDDHKLFLKGTGFLEIASSDNNNKDDDDDNVDVDNNTASSLLTFLDITQIPSIVVVNNSTGRPILGQEVAIGWNASDDDSCKAMLDRWRGGNSGLSLSQKILTTTLGDSSSVCVVM